MKDDLDNQSDFDDINDDRGKLQRSPALPIKNLTNSINFVDNVYKQLGGHAFQTKTDIARVNGLGENSIRQILSTCQQYDLLEIKFGVGYKPTDLFVSIILPKDIEEKKQSIIKSLKSPDIFKELFDLFGSNVLPPVSGIQNTLIRDFKLKPDIALKTASIFTDNLKEHGLIDERGVINLTNTIAPKKDSSKSVETEKPPPHIQDSGTGEKEPPIVDILIPLKNRSQKAHLLIPEDYNDSDLVRIIKFVEALKNDEPV